MEDGFERAIGFLPLFKGPKGLHAKNVPIQPSPVRAENAARTPQGNLPKSFHGLARVTYQKRIDDQNP